MCKMRVSSAFIAFNILDCIRLARSLLYIIYLTSFNYDIIKSCVLFLYTATHQQIDTRSWKQTHKSPFLKKNKPYFFFCITASKYMNQYGKNFTDAQLICFTNTLSLCYLHLYCFKPRLSWDSSVLGQAVFRHCSDSGRGCCNAP